MMKMYGSKGMELSLSCDFTMLAHVSVVLLDGGNDLTLDYFDIVHIQRVGNWRWEMWGQPSALVYA